jgi:hypothetical protein
MGQTTSAMADQTCGGRGPGFVSGLPVGWGGVALAPVCPLPSPLSLDRPHHPRPVVQTSHGVRSARHCACNLSFPWWAARGAGGACGRAPMLQSALLLLASTPTPVACLSPPSPGMIPASGTRRTRPHHSLRPGGPRHRDRGDAARGGGEGTGVPGCAPAVDPHRQCRFVHSPPVAPLAHPVPPPPTPHKLSSCMVHCRWLSTPPPGWG